MKPFKQNILFIFICCSTFYSFSQTTIYSWSGYTAGSSTYTTSNMISYLTSVSPNFANSSPKYYAGTIVGGGGCGIAGGLALEANFGNITNANATLEVNFTTASNGICASVLFNIKDINSDESVQTWDDFVDISAVDGNATAIAAANIVINTNGNNAYTTTSGNTKTIIGHNNSAYGSRGTTSCGLTTITITPPASTPLSKIFIKYHPDYTACANCYYNLSGPTRPSYQYISISSFTATPTTGCSIVLPVELLSFTGKCNGDRNIFNWSTASEQNNAYFNLEKSKDGENFEIITKIKGSGSSNKEVNYNYVLEENNSSYKYYRLSQTDINGKTQILKLIYLNCVDVIGNLKLYPNPANNEIKINFESTLETEFTINIIDLLGRSLKTVACFTSKNINESIIDIDDLAAGNYNVVIYNKDGSRPQTLKFIKSLD